LVLFQKYFKKEEKIWKKFKNLEIFPRAAGARRGYS